MTKHDAEASPRVPARAGVLLFLFERIMTIAGHEGATPKCPSCNDDGFTAQTSKKGAEGGSKCDRSVSDEPIVGPRRPDHDLRREGPVHRHCAAISRSRASCSWLSTLRARSTCRSGSFVSQSAQSSAYMRACRSSTVTPPSRGHRLRRAYSASVIDVPACGRFRRTEDDLLQRSGCFRAHRDARHRVRLSGVSRASACRRVSGMIPPASTCSIWRRLRSWRRRSS